MFKSMMFEIPEELNTCFITNPIVMQLNQRTNLSKLEEYLMEYAEEFLEDNELYDYHTYSSFKDYVSSGSYDSPITNISKANRMITIDLRKSISKPNKNIIVYEEAKITKSEVDCLYTIDFSDKDLLNKEFYIVLVYDGKYSMAANVFCEDNKNFKEIYNTLIDILKNNISKKYIIDEIEEYLQYLEKLDSVFVFDDMNHLPTLLYPYPSIDEEA